MPSCRSSAFSWPYRGLCVAVLAVLLSGLAGCTSAQIDSIPASVGGMPENLPKRPADSPAFPLVHDMPPARANVPLDAERQKKLEADLIATRDRQVKRTANPDDKSGAGNPAAKGSPPSKSQAAKKPKKPAPAPSGTPGPAATTAEGAGAGRNP